MNIRPFKVALQTEHGGEVKIIFTEFMALLYGIVEPFDPKDGDFSEYVERLEQYFLANTVADAKKVAILLTVIGKETYSLLRSLVAPTQPKDKSYAGIIKYLRLILNRHLLLSLNVLNFTSALSFLAKESTIL